MDLFITSKTADYKTEDGSSFRVRFQVPLQMEGKLTGRVTSAVTWWTHPNITDGQLAVTYNGVVHTIGIPTGLYQLNTLRDTIYRAFNNLNLGTLPLLFEQNDSTQRVVLTFNHATTIVNFTGNPQMATLLGFAQTSYGPFSNVTSMEAPNVAQFNTIESLQLHSDITNSGIPVNGKYYQTIANVPITANVGSQNFYSPRYPSAFECNRLNSYTTELNFWLTSEDGTTRLNTMGQPWELTIHISAEPRD